MKNQRRTARLVIAVPLLFALPGCVAWDIRDELRVTNKELDEVNTGIARTNERIEDVAADLQLANQKLDALQERLDLLDSMSASLAKLDEHLASLRKTVENIDSVVPFVEFSADKDGEPKEDPPADRDR